MIITITNDRQTKSATAVPWINNNAMKQIHVIQKNVFTFSITPNNERPVNAEDIDTHATEDTHINDKNNSALEEIPSNEPKPGKVNFRVLKIPYSTFMKIHQFRYPPISDRTNASDMHILPKLENEKSKSDSKESLEMNIQTKISLKTIIIPISTFVEVEQFLHPPIVGSSIQHTFKTFDQQNRQFPAFDTKIIDTITFYHEQPYCYLVGFKSHEIIYSTFTSDENKNKEKNISRAVVEPLHTLRKESKCEINNHHPLNIKVPVIIGEYNVELSLDEHIPFEQKVFQIKEIKKEIKVTNCKFVPGSLSAPMENGERHALKGKLFIEGFIEQQIEYISSEDTKESAAPMKEKKSSYFLHQKIILELLIQLLQVQKTTMHMKPN